MLLKIAESRKQELLLFICLQYCLELKGVLLLSLLNLIPNIQRQIQRYIFWKNQHEVCGVVIKGMTEIHPDLHFCFVCLLSCDKQFHKRRPGMSKQGEGYGW